MAEIIRVDNLRKVYRLGRVEVPALRGVNVTVQEGEFLSIVGPSGCGKSTLLYTIGGLTKPSSGKVILDGDDLGQMNEAQRTEVRRKKIGFIFQRFNLLPTLSAYGNIALAAHIAGMKNGALGPELDSIAKLLGLEHRLQHHPGELSGGEQQRVAIARAVITRPKILLADEPTGNLDTENSDLVLNLLKDLNQKMGQTIMMITHNPEVAIYSDRIVNMRDGHVLES
ncbi:MAG: ABC transporter ATP-binding protein [Acidobacteria bacterium]|nr:ABC transporter ATP-binding protein [Acidobacteriota bacterium]